MSNYIMVGADVHDKDILIKAAHNRGNPVQQTFNNTPGGRERMIAALQEQAEEAGNATVVFAYEASFLGFGLYDQMTDARFECHVLTPTRIARSSTHRKRKTDARDAERLLEVIRGHILAGNDLPSIWIPDLQTRDDRELVRMRLDVGKKITSIKSQILVLLKRNNFRKPAKTGSNWTKKHRVWLAESAKPESALPGGARCAMNSLMRQLEALEQEIVYLDKHIQDLSGAPRYAEPVQELKKLKGVGTLTAMAYLTEMGDLSRFNNRRQIGAFLGLVPSSSESGQKDDRKGHITHQGSGRVRKVLCQACRSRIRNDPHEKDVYGRIVEHNPKHKNIAVVASMRRLAIKMWHQGLKAQSRAGSFEAAVNG
ncbi:MAG: IS110 family transposase [PVC group bacterium]